METNYVPTLEQYSMSMKCKVMFPDPHAHNPLILIETPNLELYKLKLSMHNRITDNLSKTAWQKVGSAFNNVMHGNGDTYEIYFDNAELFSLKTASLTLQEPTPETMYRRFLKSERSKSR